MSDFFLKLVLKSIFAVLFFAVFSPFLCFGSSTGLQISVTNGKANLSWSDAGYWLQAAEQLGDPLAWYNSPWPATGNAPLFNATAPLDASFRFFRLVSSSSLPPPTGMRAHAGDSIIYVNWDTVSNALSYNLYYASVPGVTPANYSSLPRGAVLKGFNQTQMVFDNLAPGLRYYFVATAVGANGESASSNEGSDIFGMQGQVHGSFFTPVFDGIATNQIFVPWVAVTFQTNGVTMASATTDGGGNFTATSVPAGVYQMCWSAPGYISDCSMQQVVVSNTVAILDPQEIDPQTGSGVGMVYGNVKLRDGSAPVFDTNMFGSGLSTTIVLINSSNQVVNATTVNSFGQYLLTGVPMGQVMTLSANCEVATVSSNIDTTIVGEANLVLPNTPPVIQSVVASLNGQRISHAPAGSTVQLTIMATDAENDFLHYAWAPGPGAGNLVSADSSNLSLTLPATNGLVEVFVQVSDGHGGYDFNQFYLNAEDAMTFEGYVQDTDGNVIPNAVVTVNAATTLTDTNGFFALTSPFSQGQFLLGITAAGYAPFNKILDDSASGDIYELTPLNLVCTNWTGGPAVFSDAAGTILGLQANSLESSPGTPYAGPICVSITTYDPCANTPAYPAGNIAIDNLGNTKWITPQVTAFVTVMDAGGKPLLINPALPATVILPLGQGCTPLANASCQIPAWLWDPTNGVWRMTGAATNLASDCASGPFAAPLPQSGLLAAAEPAATCTVHPKVDKTINLPVVMKVSSQAQPIEINEETTARIEGEGITVPVNQLVTFQLLSPKEAPNDYYTNPNDKSSRRSEKDKTVIVKVTKMFAQDDNLELGLSAHIPLLTGERLENPLRFLTYMDPEKKIGPNINGGPVDEYYSAIGFPIAGSSFFKWLQKNGFINPLNGTFENNYVEDASALYFNATDLGFARSMHMKTKPGIDGKMDIAYYVVNYTTMQDAVVRPAQDNKAVATVAMDYAASILTNIAASATNYVTNRIVKFYVFANGSALGFNKNDGLRRNADLDGFGAKINPNLCVTCHGSQPLTFENDRLRGYSINPPDGDVKGHFIPFDPESFTYKTGLGVQQDQFRALNRGIYLYTPTTPAMKELIEGWYGGPLKDANNNNFSNNFVPAGWSANAAQKSLYLDAVRVSCRACHTMRDNISFNTFASLNVRAKTENLVCTTLEMPNAQRTFTIFWGSMAANIIKNGVTPDQPTLMKNQFNWGACPAPAP